MKKLLIYLDGDLYLRNYFTYNAFDLDGYDISIYANESVSKKYLLRFNPNFRSYIKNRKKRSRLRALQTEKQLFKYLKRSKSFQFRYNRSYKNKMGLLKVVLHIANLPFLNLIFTFMLQLLLGDDREVKNILIHEKPDLVIIPSMVVGAISLDFVDLCHKLKIKTLFLIDGWDNISSKTVFPLFPDYLAVWGQQSVDHAVSIQGIPQGAIFKLGTPRFDPYFIRSGDMASPYNDKYVLFTGCAIPFDELTVLKIIDETLVENGIKDIKIVYRPHPWRQSRNCYDFFIKEDYQHVIMDKQMEGYYLCNKVEGYNIETDLQPDLNYYPALLGNCLFVISPLTTMIIESAIMHKYVLTLSYDDGIHYTNPLNALRNYEHFEGIENISAFKFCYDLNELPASFLDLLRMVDEHPKMDGIEEEIKYIIEEPKEKYNIRLKKVVDRITQ